MNKLKAKYNERIRGLLHKSKKRDFIAESGGAVVSTSGSASQSAESTTNSIMLAKALKKLNGIDFLGNISEQKEDLVDYIGNVERYANHCLRGQFKRYKLTETQWRQVYLATELAKKINKMDVSSSDTEYISGSITGNSRPFCLHTTTIDGHTVLAIAFRGTKSLMEWAVNSNHDPMKFEELKEDAKCHRGLYRVAKNMESSVATELEKLLADDGMTGELNVLFTGHSSGAAIAQFLYSFMHSTSSPLARFKLDNRIVDISCVTFGGPPISNPPIERPSEKSSMFISFINEGDPVALAQDEYVTSLIKAWTQPVIEKEWVLPKPFYIPSGILVVLRYEFSENQPADDGPHENRPADSGIVGNIVPLSVKATDLEQICFGDLVKHSMTLYGKRVHSILEQLHNPSQDLCQEAADQLEGS